MLCTALPLLLPFHRLRPVTLLLTLVLAIIAGAQSVRVHAAADPGPGSGQDPELGGYLEAMVNEERILLPALKVDYEVTVHGDLAEVRVVQTFSNPMTGDGRMYSMTNTTLDTLVWNEINTRV